MSGHENINQQETVSIALRIGEQALRVLSTPPEVMGTPEAPEIALIELAPDIYALGGETIDQYAERMNSPLLKPSELDMSHATKSEVYDSVKLLLGKRTLQALEVSPSSMNGWCPPRFGLVPFGEVYRLGGDMIADYIQSRGAPILRASHIDDEGYDNQHENSLN